jgi:poly(A) polymerase
MIKKLINKILGRSAGAASLFGVRQEIGVETHGIDPGLLDERALNVVKTLKKAGFEAYIVGGAVRDLMVGLAPKDFDVATNATPEQVKALFRRAFIIGRRFRIVHVVYGRGRDHEVIEVSTFRAYLDNAAAEQVSGNEKSSKSALAGMQHAVDAHGRVLRDNVWGPQEEDAVRRDFTINAMYYDPERQLVVDYHHGIKDSKNRVIRMIGDPAKRYREDPVRIIRAVRFAAKLSSLGFKLDAQTAKPLVTSQALLTQVPQSRLFDEMLKLLQTGHALASIAQLKALGLARGIYPLLDLVVARAELPLVNLALRDTDRRVGEGKPVAPSYLLACVLWSDVHQSWTKRLAQNQPAHPALLDAIDDVFNASIGDVSGRGKLGGDMREIWMMQPRFEKRVGSAPFGLVEQARFRAAFDFMRMRAEIGEVEQVLADWWEEFSLADPSLRQDMVDGVRVEQQQRAKASRPPRRRKAADAAAPDQAAAESLVVGEEPTAGDVPEQAATDEAAAPRKRRRRRRSSAAGREGSAAPAAGADDPKA